MRALGSFAAVALLAAAAPALAGPSLTLNGVNIDGITAQRFENCTVVIDGKGNVHIEAKGYAVRAVGEPEGRPAAAGPRDPASHPGPAPSAARPIVPASATPAEAAPRQLTRRYFLATEHAPPGTQYDLAVFINAQWIREVKASEPQVVLEITRYLRPGRNKVVFAATKRIQGERLSTSRDVALKVVLGEGDTGGEHVMIDQVLVETKRTAAETEDRTEEHVFEAR
jgi:hypothetical protein